MRLVRLSENRWMDLSAFCRFERKEVAITDDSTPMVLLTCTPRSGHQVTLADAEALEVVEVLEVMSNPMPQLLFPTMAPAKGEVSVDPDIPPTPTISNLAEETLSMLRAMSEARKERASLNVFQRFHRFLFGGGQ